MKPPRATTRRHLPNSPFNAPVDRPVPEFSVDDRVTHDQYGLGTVVGVEKDVAVLVQFREQRVRIPSPFRKLRAL
ncbi:hypothetical protein ACFP6A_13710 [Quadrisphaera sp. GCM10027208]|uniref:hypothetical protein n=1 Tax=Quadrisphaera sp. GCM10027208 TaxID=3273423 RepID=UPI00361613FC